MIRASVLNTLHYDRELCTGCAMCAAVCPHGVFAVHDHAAELVKGAACMECGACQINCPAGAIAVESGVGCAAAMMMAALKGQKETTCGQCE